MSDWKKGAAKRRDERNTKGPTEVPKPRAAKKDTRKWCKGKVGVEHKQVCRNYVDVKHAGEFKVGNRQVNIYKGWKILMCEACGKELASYSPMGFDGRDRTPPDWVV